MVTKLAAYAAVLALALASLGPCPCAPVPQQESHEHACCGDGWTAGEAGCCDELDEPAPAVRIAGATTPAGSPVSTLAGAVGPVASATAVPAPVPPSPPLVLRI